MAVVTSFADVPLRMLSKDIAAYVGDSTAQAGGRHSDRQRDDQDRSRELSRQAEERARELARQAQERAREQARQAQDRAKDDDKSERATETSSQKSGGSRTVKNNDKSRNDDDTDDDDTSARTEKRGKASAAIQTKEPEGPPETIAELFKRLSTPQEQSQQPATGRHVPASPSKAPAPVKPAAQSAGKPRSTPPGPPLPPLPSNPAREVLAVNPSKSALAHAAKLGFKVAHTTGLPALGMSITRLVLPDGMSVAAARAALRESDSDSVFAANRRYQPYRTATAPADNASGKPRDAIRASTGNGCSPERCFGAQAIGWKSELRSCTKGLKVGVVDTMVDHRHPAFDDVHINVGTFISEGRKRAPSAHGTGVLAILAGGERSGTPGLMPDGEFFVADIFHIDADGQPSADTVSLLSALSWMDAWGVKIVNLSVAGPHDELMQKAIETLSNRGMIFVAAAGNEGPNAPPMYPAAYKKVVAVTAIAKDMRSYRHANRGEYIDLAAPGVDVWTAVPGAKESYQSGTSFAVPFATALLATIYDDAQTKTKDGLLSKLAYNDLGPPGRDPVFGRGLILAPPRCGPQPREIAPEVSMVRAPANAGPPPLWQPSVSYGFAPTRP